jgi:hypothetical protein
MSNPDSESIPLMDVLIPKAMKLQEEENMNDAASNFIPQDIMESDIFESSLRQVETFSDENIQNNSNIDVVELCELYQGGYNIDTQTCILPNGVVCQNYDEEGMNECFQRDDSILR